MLYIAEVLGNNAGPRVHQRQRLQQLAKLSTAPEVGMNRGFNSVVSDITEETSLPPRAMFSLDLVDRLLPVKIFEELVEADHASSFCRLRHS
jgi:hypothetical protein